MSPEDTERFLRGALKHDNLADAYYTVCSDFVGRDHAVHCKEWFNFAVNAAVVEALEELKGDILSDARRGLTMLDSGFIRQRIDAAIKKRGGGE